MANYALSNLPDGVASLTESYQKGELRFREPVIYKNLLAGTPLSVPGYEALRLREDRDFNIDFFNRTPRALGAGRTINHTGTQGDSTILEPSFATKTDKFYTSLTQAQKSRRSLQEELVNELTNSTINFSEQLNQESSDFLFAGRSGVNGVAIGGNAFNGTLDTYEISEATADNSFIDETQMVMDILKYQGLPLDYYCDTVSFMKFRRLSAQGDSNGVNSKYQFTDANITFFHMSEMNADVAALGAGAYTKGYWVVVPKGMAVCMDWVPQLNRNGVSSTTVGGVAEYGVMRNPIDGTILATHKYWGRADTSSTNGNTQDVKEEVELSVDVSFELAPLTNAGETVAQAFGIIA